MSTETKEYYPKRQHLPFYVPFFFFFLAFPFLKLKYHTGVPRFTGTGTLSIYRAPVDTGTPPDPLGSASLLASLKASAC